MLAVCGSWLLVCAADKSGAVGFIERAAVTVTAGAASATPWAPAAADTTPSAQSVVMLKVDRVAARWRRQQAAALAVGDVAAYARIKNQAGQLAEWRRLQLAAVEQEAAGDRSAAGTASAISESVLQLIEGTSQQSTGVLAPRTDGDELAWELNCSIMHLLSLHVGSELRLLRGIRVPLTASQALSQAVAMGLHGGPSVHRDLSQDVSTLLARTAAVDGAAAAAVAGAARGGTSAMARAAAAAARPWTGAWGDASDDPNGVVQLIVDVDAAAGVRGYGQPVDLFVSVYDGLNGVVLSDEARVFVDASGRLCPPPGTPSTSPAAAAAAAAQAPFTGPSPSSAWAQCVFINVPRPLVASGQCFLVVRAFRLGPLKESAAVEAAATATAGAAAWRWGPRCRAPPPWPWTATPPACTLRSTAGRSYAGWIW